MDCRKNKVIKHTKSEYSQFQAPDDRFSVIDFTLISFGLIRFVYID